MSELTKRPHYIIFQDKWQGQLRWQGYSFNEPLNEWLPVAPPSYKRGDAVIDCKNDWQQVLGREGEPDIAPSDRQYPWTGQRRFL